MAADRSFDTSQIAREAARIAREAARAARHEARDEARRIRAEAARAGREGSRFARETFESPRDGASVQEALDGDGVRQVLVKQTAGRLTIRPCRQGESPGVETSASKSPPELTVTRDGDRLIVDIRISVGRLFRRRRGADTLVRLAPGFSRLNVAMGHGHLVAGGIACEDLTIDIGAGEISLRDVHADTTIDLGAGKAVTEGHHGLVTCDLGTGDARIAIAGAKPGNYAIEVGIGQAELILPPGLNVHTISSSGLGKSEVLYPDAGEGAEITAHLNAGIGRAAIVPGGEAGSAPSPQPARGTKERRTESEEVRVLQLLEQGKISAQEAADLIAALQGVPRPGDDTTYD